MIWFSYIPPPNCLIFVDVSLPCLQIYCTFPVHFKVFFLKNNIYFIRSEGCTFRPYTFGIFIRLDVIRSVFIRSDIICLDVIRCVIIRLVGELLCWNCRPRHVRLFSRLQEVWSNSSNCVACCQIFTKLLKMYIRTSFLETVYEVQKDLQDVSTGKVFFIKEVH